MPLWQRQEIQKMSWSLKSLLRGAVLGACLACSASAQQVWPETWHGSTRTSSRPVTIEDGDLWTEFGGELAEQAEYKGPAGTFTATAWRLNDATAALAFYESERPQACTPVANVSTLCVTPGAQWMADANYVLRFEGWRPQAAEMKELEKALPDRRSGGGLPTLTSYLPEQNRVRNSERYILGIYSLGKFESRISPMLVGFEDGAEAHVAKYQTPTGELQLTLISYPTPQLARAKYAQFEKQGWVTARSGPMIAVIPGADGPAAASAERLVKSIQWQTNFTWNQATKLPPMPNVGGMLVAIFELTGVLLVACVGGGVLFAAIWIYMRRKSYTDAAESQFTSLHLEE